jgi:hypothetical protein
MRVKLLVDSTKLFIAQPRVSSAGPATAFDAKMNCVKQMAMAKNISRFVCTINTLYRQYVLYSLITSRFDESCK